MIENLEALGLSKGEVKVYLSLFELKEGTKHTIAKKAQVSESKVYEILEKLINKGLASSIIKNNVKRFYPANPNHLQEYLNKKKKELDREQSIVNRLIPQLIQKSSQQPEELQVKVYEGYNGIKSVTEEIEKSLSQKEEWLAMGITSSKKEIFNRLWIHFHKKRAQKKVKCRFIFTDQGTLFHKNLSNIPLTETKVIEQFNPTGMAIYKDKVMIFYYGQEPSCIFISNKDVAKSFTEFFNGIWKIAKN